MDFLEQGHWQNILSEILTRPSHFGNDNGDDNGDHDSDGNDDDNVEEE